VSATWIASDWHLGPDTPAGDARLALRFLAAAQRAGARVILNGDVFDELFAGRARARAAHPEVVALLLALARAGRLERLAGNHDPDAGPAQAVVDAPGLGRVLVTHGHLVDPISRSALGRLGDGISRRFGRLAVVRGAARLAEAAALAVAGRRMLAHFRRRALALVRAERCDLGVFGHVHAPHLAAGDAYANAGALARGSLTYLVLDAGTARLEALTAAVDGRPLETSVDPSAPA
jgi:UDP-2,3-diacylglucosamine pyrophosphatase LpxH